MKNFLLVIYIFILTTTIIYASPFLVCDPDPKATEYIIVFDGATITTPAPLNLDLESITEGEHVLEVRAKNTWGVSSAVPFTFTKELPLTPTNIGLSQ